MDKSYGGVTFRLEDKWLDANHPSGLDSEGRALDAALAAIFAGTESSAFLSSLAGKVIYVIRGAADQGGDSPRNANMYTDGLNKYVGWPKGTTKPERKPSYDLLDKAQFGGQGIPRSELNFLFIGEDVLPSSSTDIATPSGKSTIDAQRLIFHELAHAVTLPDDPTAQAFLGPEGRFFYEDVAIAAENYIYRKDFMGPVRVGHTDSVTSSFDPTAPFSSHSAAVRYSTGSNGDSLARVFTQDRPDQGSKVVKTYYSENYKPGSRGKYNNYVTVEAIGTQPLLSEDASGSVARSATLNSVIAGAAHTKATDRIDDAVTARDSAKSGAQSILTWFRAANVYNDAPSVDWLTELSKFRLDDIYQAKGLTNELSVSDKPLAGPQIVHTTKAATWLELGVSSGSIIFGASGFSQKGVNFNGKADDIKGSEDKDLIFVGHGSAPKVNNQLTRNRVDALGGNDVILGGEKNDDIMAGDGNDLVVASKGDDKLNGGFGQDTLIVGDDLKRAVIEVKANGGVTLSSGSSGGEKSILTSFEMYVGGAQRVTFRQVVDSQAGAKPATFVAGAGGADFYLAKGGIAVGRDGVVDNFYLSDSILQGFSGDRQAYLRSNYSVLINVEASDRIYMPDKDKPGDWKLFSGANTTSTLLPKLYNGPSDDTAGGGVQVSGTSSYGLKYATPQSILAGEMYGFDGEINQRTVNYIPLGEVAKDFGIINFADYTTNGDNIEEVELNNYLNVIINYSAGTGGMTFTRDSLSLILPFEFADTFWDAHGPYLYMSGQYPVGPEYGDYQYYNLSAGDWDWGKRDERVYGYPGQSHQTAIEWAVASGLVAEDPSGYRFGNIWEAFYEIDPIDLNDSQLLIEIFGEDANSSENANVTIRLDPLLGISTAGTFAFAGEWRQGGVAVTELDTAVGTLTFSGSGVSLGDFILDPAQTGLAEGEEVDPGRITRGTFVPDDPGDGGPIGSHVMIVAEHLAPEDEDARANLVSADSGLGTLVGLDLGLGDFIASTGSPTFTYSLVTNGGGAFAIDGQSGTVSVASTSALAALAGTSATLTVRISTAHGHRDANFAVSVSGASSYTALPGTTGNDALTGSAGNDDIDGGDGDDTLDGGAGNDRLRGGSGTNILVAGEGNDILIGGDGDDELAGGSGNDLIAGNGGDNVIRFDADGGYDVVTSNSSGNSTSASSTIIAFGAGITANDLTFAQSDDGRDLIVHVGTQGEGLVIDGLFAEIARYGTFSLVFDDASTLSVDAIAAAVAAASEAPVTREASGSQPAVLIGGQGADMLTGGAGNDILSSGTGTDILDGGAGADRMAGGGGDDLYIVDDAADAVIEAEDGGWDEVRTSLSSYTAADHVEAITYTGSASFTGVGNDQDNLFTGGAADDSFAGGLGDDSYIVTQSGDLVIEAEHEGQDEALTALAAYTLSDNVENLTYTGTANFAGNGNAVDNILTGGIGDDTLSGAAGDDVLDGGAGLDTMTGGTGDDTYLVDHVDDVVIEASNEGRDTVATTLTSYGLGSDVEDLRYEGSEDFSGDGNALNNAITSGAGNDWLDGGAGADRMTGGFGDDTYHIDDAGDLVIEGGGAGVDLITTSIDRTLDANVEDLQFVGTGAFEGTGNDLGNSILGGSDDDTLAGLGGNDRLDGGLGADLMTGGSGDDTYIVDDAGDLVVEAADEGTDTIQTTLGAYALGANLENLLAEGSGNFEGTGNALDNVLAGTTGTNILTGGTGNDHYWVLSGSTTVVEQAGEGIDEVVSYVGEWTLAANIENLTFDEGLAFAHGIGNGLNNILTGSVYGSRLEGLAGDDIYHVFRSDDEIVELAGEGVDEVRLTDGSFFALSDHVEHLTYLGEENFTGVGNALDNVMTGATGDDVLDGGLGADTMIGKTGNDLYVVDDIGDTIVELADEGIDFVETTLNAYTLQTNIEGVEFTGTGDFQGTGGADDDRLVGGDGDDTLVGAGGNDLLDGRAGADQLEGGDGDDTYVVDDAADLIVELADEGTDTVSASGNYTLGSNVENLTYSGTGAFTGTGNALANRITGGSGNDQLDGGAGDDILVGGQGNDVYVIDSAGDTIVELARQGTDEVRTSLSAFTLSSGLEKLTYLGSAAFTGVGNVDDNVIVGGAGNDDLSGADGNDELHGGAGTDMLAGGTGNDHYFVDDAADIVTEAASAGSDTVNTTSSSFTLGANIETLRYEGAGDFTGTGNDLANLITSGIGADQISGDDGDDEIWSSSGDDILHGGNGNDQLNGEAGADTIYGGAGNDRFEGGFDADALYGGAGDDYYSIDDSDTVTEYADEGIDTVRTYAHQTYTLGANVENLQLDHWTTSYGTGNALANTITGSWADNRLSGLGGDDILVGNGGSDNLAGGEGNDTLNGGSGQDFAFFDGDIATYSINTSGGSIAIVDNDTVADGDDGTDSLINVETAVFKDGSVSLTAPIVLDLDGNGVSLTSIVNSNAVYDFDGDGVGSKTSWIGRGDGLLFYDRNGDGTVSGNELSFVSDRAGAKSDLDGLVAYDSNSDGVLSTGDSAFGRFGVWADRNTDGKVDEGEILTLSQAGVASIGLGGEAVNRTWSFGDAVVINNGSFTRSDGSKSAFADVVFTYGDDTLPFSAAAQAPPSGVPSAREIVHPDLEPQREAFWDTNRWRRELEVDAPLGIGGRYGLQPIFDVPGLIVPIGTDFYSGSADGTIQSAASALVQSIAAFTPTVAAEAISERSEEYSRRDFWLAQGRPANHMAPI